MRRRLAAVAVLGVLVAVAGCGSTPPVVTAEPALLKLDVPRVDPPADAPVAQVLAGIESFGYDLAPTRTTTNWVASPASIAVVFAMLRAGAAGQTAAELDATFGFPADVHAAFNALTAEVVTTDAPPAPSDTVATRDPAEPPAPSIVCVGNAIFPAKNFPIEEDYLRVLAQQYGSGVYPVDFHSAEALGAIDAWAQRQTAGRIAKVFESLDPDTAAVIANTVYFKGEWSTPFDASRTADAPFHRADGSSVTGPTMVGQLFVGYADGPGWQAIELPYGPDGAYAMRLLLPTGEQDPRDLLNPAILSDLTFEVQAVNIELPRFNFAAQLELKEELQRLGVVSIFDPDAADLSGISSIALYVEQAVHKATISVDEAGTEAAAVTAAAISPTSAPLNPPSFTADHPFAFAIVHTATGTPLFEGIVADPTAA